jgi:hypothetical protein
LIRLERSDKLPTSRRPSWKPSAESEVRNTCAVSRGRIRAHFAEFLDPHACPCSGPQPRFAALLDAARAHPGCLGVDTVQTTSGKQVIFAWFEDKAALVSWYKSDAHQRAMRVALPHQTFNREPLPDTPDNSGQILAIVSLKINYSSAPKEAGLPVAAIGIELYTPLPGGVAVGGRFAPKSVRVPALPEIELGTVLPPLVETAQHEKEGPVTYRASDVATEDPRRSAILNAAFCLLMQHGYERTSTLDIASRAKVSKRELYHQFSIPRRISSAPALPHALSACSVLLHCQPPKIAQRSSGHSPASDLLSCARSAIRPWSQFTVWQRLSQSARPR